MFDNQIEGADDLRFCISKSVILLLQLLANYNYQSFILFLDILTQNISISTEFRFFDVNKQKKKKYYQNQKKSELKQLINLDKIQMEIKVVQNQNEVYQKEKLLGQGAFGKAYLVKHKHTGEQLVIKEMNIEHMSSKEKEETIKQAQILRNLSHPNIVNFKQVYITKNNKLKIVMEYAECGDLAKAIAQRKSKKQYFDESHILGWFTQICLAIKHVHDRKILHRDIKGQNIFIAKNNSLKLGDFGIARVLNMTHDKARTVVGTPYYLSPEIIQNKPYSFKSDIWSIGAVLYQLCCLQPPFQANSLQMLALKIVKGSYTPIQGNYSQDLKSLVASMLTLDPNKRPNINQILQKPVIQSRIRDFLSETKRIAEFSHTILHNQKVQIFANKLVQIQKEKQMKGSNSNQKNLQYERQKLKQEQARMEMMMKKKKEEEKKKEEKRLQDEVRKRQQEIRRKQQEKKRRLVYEQEKKEQMQRQYEDNIRKAELMKMRKMEEERQYQRQMQMANLMRQKQQYQQRKRRQAENARKMNKKMQEDKKMQDFNDFARKQYYQNLQIRKRAQERARREQQGSYYVEPVKEADMGMERNYHYAEQNRPKTKQESRGNSYERKQNNSDFYNNQKKKDPEPTEQQLINAFCNPNYKKGSTGQSSKRDSTETNLNQQRRGSASNVADPKYESNKKIEDERQKMKKDRQSYLKNKQKQNEEELPKQKQVSQPQEVSKWGRKKSAEKKQQKQESPTRQGQSPQFRNPKDVKESPKTTQTEDEEKGFDTLIRDSQNLFLEAKNPAQFDRYIGELEGILQGVQQRIQLLPEIPLADEIVFRDDDEFELSLTVEPKKDELQIDTQDVDLDYFSNYSKLQTLRMQLEEALGLDNFIRLYRYIEKQVSEKGLEGFNIVEAIKQVGGDIDSKVVNKNVTLLLTLVALEDKMSYT